MTTKIHFDACHHQKQAFQGKWIVVEGPDRIGKTTLIRNLQSRISAHGINVMTNGFPRRKTPIGTLLDQTLKSRDTVKDWKAQTLLFLSDMLEAQEEIKSWRALENGNGTVITDRYVASTYAYAKAQRHEFHTSKDEEWLNKVITLLPQPDAYVILIPEDNDICFLTQRSNFGCEVTEREDIQQQVVKNYLDILTKLREELSSQNSNPKVIEVVVGKDNTPETICDGIVMPGLMRALSSYNDEQQTRYTADPYTEVLFNELVVPRLTAEYERNPRVRTVDKAATMPTII